MRNSETAMPQQIAEERLPALPVLEDKADREEALDTTRSFLVQAPAGSGKTELLIRRFLKLLAEVDEPEEILAITFTRAATAEMRGRVLKALEKARNCSEDPKEGSLLAAASAALRNDATRGWRLIEQPHRLNIQTIDSLSLEIAQRTPLLSRLGGSLNPTEHAEPLYALAARRTLGHLGGDQDDLSQAIRELLELRDTSLKDCEKLIAEMLETRDLWGPILGWAPSAMPGKSWEQARRLLEEPFARARQAALQRARALFGQDPGLWEELLVLAAYACANLTAEASDTGKLRALHDVAGHKELESHEQWAALCHLLLTGSNDWRKGADKNLGFPPRDGGEKGRFKKLMDRLRDLPGALDLLCEIRKLPPSGYSAEQWRLLEKILLVLRYAIAELRVLFAERGEIDFVETGLAARSALSADPNDPESALPPALSWRHLLVDEFQDTSRSQYDLLTLLVEHRDQETRGTCFLVGDPMQSIYGFRQAEVELFERTRHYGLGGSHFEFVQLRTNFRSHAGLVAPLNEIFEKVFAAPATPKPYRVAFTPSVAREGATEDLDNLHIAPRFMPPRPDPEQREAGEEAEAAAAVAAIERMRTSLPDPDQALIAVLVRAKKHLMRIAQKLREAGVPFRAVEIENLGDRQEILDLAALTRSLLQPMDRVAWLSVLRAPWCGLTLRDLHILCGEDDRELAREPLLRLLRQRIGLLSSDGQQRAFRTADVLDKALHGKHRQASFSSWVERVWRSLGGRECVDPTGYENARAFFRMLEEVPPDGSGLETLLERLFAEPDPRTSESRGVQLMTIHKAKGLGFDMVLVPGLHRNVATRRAPLLHWLERTTLEVGEGTEEREFLVAPIGRKNGEKDPLYSWVSQQKKLRESEEAKRLLYVACTRAKSKLHLLGAATVKEDVLMGGARGSLLQTAWPGIAPQFRERWEKSSVPASTFASPSLSLAPAVSTPAILRIQRLPSDWTPSAPEQQSSRSAGPAGNLEIPASFLRPEGSFEARALGRVVHSLLEEIAICLRGRSAAELSSEIGDWRTRAMVLLRQAGLARADAERESAVAVQALQSALEDEHGRWILSPRPSAESETSWSTPTDSGDHGELFTTRRGDRIFRAGAKPLSLEETHLWVVDYKTARHSGTGLDAFLDQEREKYRRQLEGYADTLRKIHGEDLRLRLALYYPLLKRLLWWDAELKSRTG